MYISRLFLVEGTVSYGMTNAGGGEKGSVAWVSELGVAKARGAMQVIGLIKPLNWKFNGFFKGTPLKNIKLLPSALKF